MHKNHIVRQGSQTRIDWRATFQRKMLCGPHFIGEKAYAGRKLIEEIRKSAKFDQNL